MHLRNKSHNFCNYIKYYTKLSFDCHHAFHGKFWYVQHIQVSIPDNSSFGECMHINRKKVLIFQLERKV